VVATERRVAEREVLITPPTEGRGLTLLRLLEELHTDLLSTTGPHLRPVVEAYLGRLASMVGASRAIVWRVGDQPQGNVAEFEWNRPGTPPLERHLVDHAFPLSSGQLAGTNARIELGEVAEWFGAQVVLAVPVTVEGRVVRLVTLGWASARPDPADLVVSGDAGRPADAAVAADAGVQRALSCFAMAVHSAAELGSVSDRASYDDVAGLANRRLMLFMLGHLLARLGRNRSGGVAVMLCPVAIETPGGAGAAAGGGSSRRADPSAQAAAAGRLARALQRVTRSTDLVASFDGRTLAVLCDDLADDREALRVAARLQAVATDVLVGRRGTGQAVIGVGFSAEPIDAGVLLRRADQAIFVARNNPDQPIELCSS
jgi:hypothetical protein